MTASSFPPVQISGITHRFGGRRALTEVDLEVTAGRIVGLVGPNGSGKTTLLKVTAGLLQPWSGSVRLFGSDPQRDRVAVMERARFALAPPPLFEALTAREHLHHLGNLGNLGRAARVGRREVERALDTVELLHRADDRVGTFSFGMRQRLTLAQALVPMPDLLVLDEPTDGLDPLAILELRAVLKGLRDEHGVSILLSSHLLIEIDELVDRMAVLAEGRVIFEGAPMELRAEGRGVEVRVDDVERARRIFEAHGIVVRTVVDDALMLEGELDLEGARTLLRNAGLDLRAFHTVQPSLERALIDRLRRHRAEDAGDDGVVGAAP